MKRKTEKTIAKFLKIEQTHKGMRPKTKISAWKKQTGLSAVSFYHYKNLASKMGKKTKIIKPAKKASTKNNVKNSLFGTICIVVPVKDIQMAQRMLTMASKKAKA